MPVVGVRADHRVLVGAPRLIEQGIEITIAESNAKIVLRNKSWEKIPFHRIMLGSQGPALWAQQGPFLEAS